MSTNAGMVDNSSGGNSPPDFSAMLKEQSENNAKTSQSAQEKAEAMMREAVERANRGETDGGVVDVEATPSQSEPENDGEDEDKSE